MEKATVITDGETQTVRLPQNVRLSSSTVYVRQEGESVVLEPVPADAWPDNFFESIHIDDPAFGRPEQGQLPPIRAFSSGE